MQMFVLTLLKSFLMKKGAKKYSFLKCVHRFWFRGLTLSLLVATFVV